MARNLPPYWRLVSGSDAEEAHPLAYLRDVLTRIAATPDQPSRRPPALSLAGYHRELIPRSNSPAPRTCCTGQPAPAHLVHLTLTSFFNVRGLPGLLSGEDPGRLLGCVQSWIWNGR